MKTCTQRQELKDAIRAGSWPLGCASELRAHVTSCEGCTAEARMLSAFAAAREGTMRQVVSQSPELLWWKAQLRRRREAMERLEGPAVTLPVVATLGSVVLLAILLASVWNRIAWTELASLFVASKWNIWVSIPIVTAVCGFAVAAIIVGFGNTEERN